jgi:tetracycline repressor-like protein
MRQTSRVGSSYPNRHPCSAERRVLDDRGPAEDLRAGVTPAAVPACRAGAADARVTTGALYHHFPNKFTELDERGAVDVIVSLLRSATEAGRMSVEDPGTIARLLLGALTRGGMLIAGSPDPRATRDTVARGIRAMLAGLATGSASR